MSKELVRLEAQVRMLRYALMDIRELIDGYVDIVDGPEGKQLPNGAMRAVQVIEEALNGRY